MTLARTDGVAQDTAPNGKSIEGVASRAQSNPTTCTLTSELRQRIEGMLSASARLNYDGTLLIEYGNDREFVEVSSRGDGDAAHLRRLNRQVDPAPQPVTVNRRSPASACALQRSYAFKLDSSAGVVVAGREVVRLSIRPRDTMRFGYLMDIDRDSNLPLRVTTALPDGQILERYEFARVSIDALSESSDGSVMNADGPTDDKSSAPRFVLAGLPPGFQVVGGGQAPVEHLVVSDGLASVSVFVEPQPRALTDGEGVVLRGSTLSYTQGTVGKQLITVMGEVPVTTARLLAESVRPVSTR